MATPEQQPKRTLEAALSYHRRGLRVIPVKFRDKVPALDGWQHTVLDEGAIRVQFEGIPRNVGVVLGEASGDLVDVEDDCDEAVALGAELLPHTGAVFGRKSKPRSHRLYYAPGAGSIKFKDTDGKVLMELRANGCQTVFPPSVHPSNELVIWEGENGMPEPPRVEAKDLERACRERATAALIARHLPPVGGRHDFALPLVGFLMRRLDAETAGRIVHAAWEAAGDTTEKAHRDLDNIIRDTAKKLDAGQKVSGGPTLEGMSPGLPGRIAEWWGWEVRGGEEEAPREGLLEKRLLVGKAITEGIEPPPALIDGVLYAGKIHAWHGEPGTGKSILALWAACEVVRSDKSVLYLDEEGSLDAVSERMEGLGVDPEALDERFYYIQSPGITLEKGSLNDLREAAREVKPALVVFDSWADFLALEGLNENDSVDVTRWVLNVAYPLRDLGATVLLLDHLNKEAKGKGGRGSTAKFAKLDVGHRLVKVEDFDRNHLGRVRFVREKDRLAALEQRIVFEVGGDGEGRIVCLREGDVTVVTDGELTLNERAALDALEGGGLTYTEWKKAAGQPASSFQKSKAGLMEKGLVRQGTDKRYYPTREGGDSPTHPDSPPTHGAHVSHAGEESPPKPTTHSDSGALGPESVSQGGDPREQSPMSATVPERPPPVLVTSGDVPALVAEIKDTEVVGLDLESTGLDPRSDRIRLMSLATERGVWVADLFAVDPTQILEALKEKTLVIHNAAFDLAFLHHLGHEHGGEVVDTMLLSQLLYAGANVPPLTKGRTSHALDAVVERELGATLDKEHQTAEWGGELTQEMVEYAARDAEILLPLHRELMEKIEAVGLSRTLEIEQRAQRGILWMARSGLPFDEARWLELAEEARREAARLDERLQEMAPPHPEGKEWNFNSAQQVRQVLALLGLPVDDTRDETLARLDHDFVRLLREYRKKNGTATRHGEKWLLSEDGTSRVIEGRIYPSWKQIGAATGRMACAEPNLQAIPHGSGHHSCVRAPERRVLIKADYSQIELRIAAKMWGEPVMLRTFREGGDVHTTTARSITGKQEVTKEERKLAKAVNFGLIFGQGAKGLKDYARNNYGVEMTLEEAQRYRERFFETYPAIKAWHRKEGQSFDSGNQTARSLTGRMRRVGSFTEKINHPVQGTAADGMKMALALLWERRNECPGAVPVLAVHDEIVVECDEGDAKKAEARLKKAMKDGMDAVVNATEPRVPIEVEVSVSKTWGD